MDFHEELKSLIHQYVKFVYKVTKNFPQDELYGIVSQFRRAAISVMLNYVEGYARRSGDECKVYSNFLKIAYGSLRESKYLLFFSFDEKYISEEEYTVGFKLADRIGGMLWSIIK
ncbi:MAG TPA: four helix bundle protein [Candidatus Methylomirabilis sp.]|nr:four helix bundle protein [Candidatus Methylomirabilis sp.]